MDCIRKTNRQSDATPGVRGQNINKKCCKVCEYFMNTFTASSMVTTFSSGAWNLPVGSGLTLPRVSGSRVHQLTRVHDLTVVCFPGGSQCAGHFHWTHVILEYLKSSLCMSCVYYVVYFHWLRRLHMYSQLYVYSNSKHNTQDIFIYHGNIFAAHCLNMLL